MLPNSDPIPSAALTPHPSEQATFLQSSTVQSVPTAATDFCCGLTGVKPYNP